MLLSYGLLLTSNLDHSTRRCYFITCVMTIPLSGQEADDLTAMGLGCKVTSVCYKVTQSHFQVFPEEFARGISLIWLGYGVLMFVLPK